MIYWNTPNFEEAPVDTQVFIDDRGGIYRYDDTSAVWKLYKDAKLVKKHAFYLFFKQQRQTTYNPLIACNELQAGGVVKEGYWNDVYSKSFLKIYNENFEYYIQGVTASELFTWMQGFLPNSGGFWDFVNLNIDCYFVQDDTLNIDNNLTAHNSLYAVCRGRKCYYSKPNRINNNKGLDAGFHSTTWSNTFNNFGSLLVHAFTMNTPVDDTDNELAITFSNANSLYGQPKVSSFVRRSDSYITYDTVNRVFIQNDVTDYYVGTPIYMSRYGNVRNIYSSPNELFKFANFMNSRSAIIAIYPLYSTDGSRLMFLIKPIGVDYVTIKYPRIQQDFDVFAEVDKKDNYTDIILKITNTGEPDTLSQNILAYDAMPGIYKESKTSRKIPKNVRFYIQNKINGVISKSSTKKLKILSNKTNAPLSVAFL